MSIKRSRAHVAAAAVSAVAAGVFAATAAAAPPANTAPPSISGTPTVGQTLTASEGTWSNTPTSFAYQWLRCNGGGNSCADVANGTQKTYTLVGADVAACSNVVGATAKTYGIQAGDLGYRLRVTVTARNAKGSATATSAITT